MLTKQSIPNFERQLAQQRAYRESRLREIDLEVSGITRWVEVAEQRLEAARAEVREITGEEPGA